jgi:SNF2 family DNA or RNA helicase
MLELTGHRLAQAGVRHVTLQGSMTVPARDRVIDAFRNDPNVTVCREWRGV